MKTRISAVIATCALSFSAVAVAAPLAFGEETPSAPAATCPSIPPVSIKILPAEKPADRKIEVSGIVPEHLNNYRYVVYKNVDGTARPERQVNKSLRNLAHAGTLTVGDVLKQYKIPAEAASEELLNSFIIKPYYRVPAKTFTECKETQTIDLAAGDPLTRVIPLFTGPIIPEKPAEADSANDSAGNNPVKPIDNCVAKDPTKYTLTAPVADEVKFKLVAAKLVDGKATENILQLADDFVANDDLRVVARFGDKAFSLKKALRDELFAKKQISAERIKAYYAEQFKNQPEKLAALELPYGNELSVQFYLFDKNCVADPKLYDTDLQLTVGKADRFISFSKPAAVTLVDPAKLTADTKPAPDTKPDTKPKPGGSTATPLVPLQPAEPVWADIELGTQSAKYYWGEELKAAFTMPKANGETEVIFYLHSSPVKLGKQALTTLPDGSVLATVSWKVPTDFPVGAHHVVVTDVKGKELARVGVEILKRLAKAQTPAATTAPVAVPPRLANTGTTTTAVMLALVTAVFGGLFIALRKRH